MAQCIGKKRFATEEDAARALELIRSSPEAWDRPKVPAKFYHCDVCQDWHLTAMTSRGVKRRKKGVVRG